jgi:hypothetical protein
MTIEEARIKKRVAEAAILAAIRSLEECGLTVETIYLAHRHEVSLRHQTVANVQVECTLL